MRETRLLPPKLSKERLSKENAGERYKSPATEETTRSRLPGILFILVGVLLMALSGLTALPQDAPDELRGERWENVSNSREGSSVVSGEPGEEASVVGADDDSIESKGEVRDYVIFGPGGATSFDDPGLALSDCEAVFAA